MQHYIEDFMNYLKSEVTSSNNTLYNYAKDLKDFTGIVTQIDQESIDNYFVKLKQQYSIATINRKISAIRHFFDYLTQEQIISKSPVKNLKLLKQHKKIPKYLTEKQVKYIFHTLNNNNEQKKYIIFELLYATGMRVSEIASLKINDIKHEETRDYINVTGKGNKQRIIPLHAQAALAIKHYTTTHGSKDYLFPATGKQPHISRQRIGQMLKEIANEAQIDSNLISPHIIRHSFATHLMNKGVDIKFIQELLGHSNISSTQIYTHAANQHLHKIVNQYHPLASQHPDHP